MKRISCKFEESPRWDEFESYVESTYPTEHYELDESDNDFTLVFYGSSAKLLREWFSDTAEVAGVRLLGITEEELSAEDWNTIRGELESTLDDRAAPPASALEELVQRLQSEDVESRRAAAYDLAELRSEAASAVPALAVALKDRESTVRRASAEAIAFIGSATTNEIPALIDALCDEDEGVRNAANRAIREADIAKAVLVAVYRGHLSHSEPDIRSGGALSLAELGEDAKAVVPEVIALLRDHDSHVREAAAWALLDLGRFDKDAAVRALREALDDDSIRSSVMDTLETLES